MEWYNYDLVQIRRKSYVAYFTIPVHFTSKAPEKNHKIQLSYR